MYSRLSFLCCALILAYTSIFFYPKWEQGTTEATLSWDVSGYYLYLPAIFIYDDLKRVEFLPDIITKYRPTPDPQQAFPHESGHNVLKYSCGQALLYVPFFAIGHQIALRNPDYALDGFSYPYQAAIGYGGLFVALLGLWFVRKNLLRYFDDLTTAFALLIVVVTTNYLEYAGVNNAMSHNYLFTLHAIMIWCTIRFHEKPSYVAALGIGGCIGLAALTRPTEIIVAFIPLLWGLEGLHKTALQKQLKFLKANTTKIALAIAICIAIGCLQLVYWKYVTGSWLVYSYEEQGFSWLTPHLWKGMMSYRSGWLIYTPSMLFALLGFRALYLHYRKLFWVVLAYVSLHVYITFAWDIWWYGGSLGQRAMIQAYPMLCFTLAAFIEYVRGKKSSVHSVIQYVVLGLCMLFAAYNFWLTQQARPGKLLRVGEMSGAYLWEILFQQEVPLEAQKLLDTREQFKGERRDIHSAFQENFDAHPLDSIHIKLDGASSSVQLLLNKQYEYSPIFTTPQSAIASNTKWLRVQADYYTPSKEWETWRMAQLIVRFWDKDKKVKTRYIRLHRLLTDKEWKTIWLDMRLPRKAFSHVDVQYWNGVSEKTTFIDNLTIESFR